MLHAQLRKLLPENLFPMKCNNCRTLKRPIPNRKFIAENGHFIKVGEKYLLNFKTDTDKLNLVVYRYRNSLYLNGKEVGPKKITYQTLSTK